MTRFAAADVGQVEWHATTRVAFRFACIWFVLICFPSPLVFIPGLNILAAIYGEISAELAATIAKLVFGISIIPAETGSTDRAVDWYLLGFFSVVSVLATLVWSWRTEAREHARLYDRLRVYIRYTLGSAMFTYAAIKIVKIQFPDPDVDWLMESYGASSPYRLLWMFMGHSSAYGAFVGCVELVGACAVLFRRTVTIGALLLVGALSNVVMINLCYDVPVKLWSIQLLLMSAFLLLPDLQRLADVFLFNQPTDAVELRAPAPPTWKTRARPFVKAALIGCSLFTAGQTAFSNRTPPPSPLHGFYEVSTFTPEGRERPPSLFEPAQPVVAPLTAFVGPRPIGSAALSQSSSANGDDRHRALSQSTRSKAARRVAFVTSRLVRSGHERAFPLLVRTRSNQGPQVLARASSQPVGQLRSLDRMRRRFSAFRVSLSRALRTAPSWRGRG